MPQESFTINKLSKRFHKKRFARIMAIQTIYSTLIDGAEKDIDLAIFNVIKINELSIKEEGFAQSDEKLLIMLARSAHAQSVDLIAVIQKHLSKDWRFERLGKVVQAVLLVSAFELMSHDKAEVAVVINEYLEIAKDLNHQGEVGFINSVLDGISKNLI